MPQTIRFSTPLQEIIELNIPGLECPSGPSTRCWLANFWGICRLRVDLRGGLRAEESFGAFRYLVKSSIDSVDRARDFHFGVVVGNVAAV